MTDDPLVRLPAEEREVLTLRLQDGLSVLEDGLSVLEIARRTNRSPRAVREIAMQALRRLRTVTENERHPAPED